MVKVLKNAPWLCVCVCLCDCTWQVSLELLRSVLSKESALNDLDCVDKLLGMIAPILRDPPIGGRDEMQDAAMQVSSRAD